VIAKLGTVGLQAEVNYVMGGGQWLVCTDPQWFAICGKVGHLLSPRPSVSNSQSAQRQELEKFAERRYRSSMLILTPVLFN